MPEKLRKLSQQEKLARTRDNLVNTAENMRALAKDLSTEGRELNSFERQMCRLAAVLSIQEEFDIALMNFMQGREARPIDFGDWEL